MKIAIIGRTEILYNSALRLREAGYQIVCILTAKEAPEYTHTAADFRKLADDWQIPFAQGTKIIKHIDLLKSAQADIGISINYTSVVPQSVIDLFSLGVLNAHGGDLPRYRGNACQAWAILNGEKHIGLCIHKMAGGELDSGEIIARDYLPIDCNTKVTQVWEWMTTRTPELMLEAVHRLNTDPSYFLEQQSKDPTDALRCYPRKPEDGRIDWHKSNIEILRLINACNRPYAGAFCEFEGKKMTIWDASLAECENFLAIPGQITKIDRSFVEVATGNGKLKVKLIEVQGEMLNPSDIIFSIRQRLT